MLNKQKNIFLIFGLSIVLLYCLSTVSASENVTDDIVAVSNDMAMDEVVCEVDFGDESTAVQAADTTPSIVGAGEGLKDPGLNLTLVHNGVLVSFNEENVTGFVIYSGDPNFSESDCINYNGTPFLIDLNGFEADEYPVVVRYLGNDVYASAQNFEVVEVEPNYPGLKATVNGTQITVTFDRNVTMMDFYVQIPGEEYSRSYFWWIDPVTVNLSDLSPGKYSIDIMSGSDNYYTTESVNVNVTVKKETPSISISADNIKYGEDLVVNVDLPDDVSRRATVTIGNETKLVSLKNGKGSAKFSGLAVGKHPISVSYNGDNKYAKASINTTVKVNRASTHIKVSANPVVYGDDVIVDVQLPSDVARRVKVTIGNESKIVSLKNGKGSAKFSGLVAGTHNITVSYNGDVNYLKASVNTTVNVKKATPEIKVNSIDIEGDETITVEMQLPCDVAKRAIVIIDGVQKYASLKNGMGSVKFTGLSAVTHEIEVAYSGDANYKKASTATTLTVENN